MSAIISPCKQYRYTLTRAAECVPTRLPALFVMLNPSTANATEDDATIRRCRAFAKAWGCDGLTVANLYALRSTDPKNLWCHLDPVGPLNDRYLSELVSTHSEVVCAWGMNARPERVEAAVAVMQAAGARLMCLGVTQSGAPRHPLYVKGNQPLVEWTPITNRIAA